MKKVIKLNENTLKQLISEALNELEEMEVDPSYTHFAVNKQTGKIVNGWDYNGYDPTELRQYKRDYFISDLIDMEIDPKICTILTKNSLIKRGIDPQDWSNWA